MNKKIIIPIIILIVFLIIGGVIFFFREKSGESRIEKGFFSLFPFIGEREIDKEDLGLTTVSPKPDEGKPVEGLVMIDRNAVSGAVSATGTIVRYVEQSTGHIYEFDLQTKNVKRISNTTILKTFDILWSTKTDKLAIRYIEDEYILPQAKTFLAKILVDRIKDFNVENATSTLDGVFLPDNAIAITVSPSEDKIFYLTKTDILTSGTVANFDNQKRSTIFSSSFSEFNLEWPNKDIISLNTKPSNDIEGFLYFLNPQTGSFSKILGGIKGLTSLVSPDGSKIIYSESLKRGVETRIFNVKSKVPNEFMVTTLPEKCIWSKKEKEIVYCAVPKSFPPAEYPDSWYQGLVSFDNDSIWKINLSTGQTDVLLDDSNADIIKPFLNPTEDYFIFINKKDNTLWSVKLKE